MVHQELSDEDNLASLISDWHRRNRQSQRVNYDMGTYYDRLALILRVSNVTLTIFVGSGVFLLLSDVESTTIRVVTGALGVSSVVVAMIDAILNLDRRAESYRRISARYGILRRDLELLAHRGASPEIHRDLEHVKRAMDELALEGLPVKARVKRRAVADLDSKPRRDPKFGVRDDRAISG